MWYRLLESLGERKGVPAFKDLCSHTYGHTMECEPELFNGTTGMALST